MSPTAIETLAPEIKVNGVALTAAQTDALLGLRVELALCLVGRATLRLADPGYGLSATGAFTLGDEVAITVPKKGQLFSGQVTAVSLEQSQRDHPELVVVADDAGYKLGRGLKSTTYLKMSYSDVLRKICGELGLTADIQGNGLNDRNDYLLQTGTALAYVDRIAQRTGSVWWIDGRKLVVRPAGTSSGEVAVTLGEDLVEFSVRATGLTPGDVSVYGWDPASQNSVVGTGSVQPGDTSTFVSSNTKSASLGTAKANVAGVQGATQSEATNLASAMFDEAKAAAAIARGTCVIAAGLRPSSTIKVDQAGPASGSYYVSEVEHIYSARGFQTRFVAGPRRSMNLVDTLGPARSDPGFVIGGLVIGIVTNNRDDQNPNTVRVRFTGLDGQIESAPARVVSLGAGSARGAVFYPEIDDEVLVGFEHNDSRRPIVIGGLHSPKKELPQASTLVASGGKVDYRRITSRKGHVLEFADGDDPATQHFLLQLGTAKHKLRLGKDAFDIDVESGTPVTIKAGSASFAITAAGDVKIAGKNITLAAEVAVQIEGKTGATLKSGAKVAVQGAMVEVKADATASVQASGPLALKGAVVQIN